MLIIGFHRFCMCPIQSKVKNKSTIRHKLLTFLTTIFAHRTLWTLIKTQCKHIYSARTNKARKHVIYFRSTTSVCQAFETDWREQSQSHSQVSVFCVRDCEWWFWWSGDRIPSSEAKNCIVLKFTVELRVNGKPAVFPWRSNFGWMHFGMCVIKLRRAHLDAPL